MKSPKTALHIEFGIATVQRLASDVCAARLLKLFKSLPAAWLPTHFAENEPVRRPFALESFSEIQKILSNPMGGWLLFEYRGAIQGRLNINAEAGPNTFQNSIKASFELSSLKDESLIDSVRSLFRQFVEWSDAEVGSMAMTAYARGGGWNESYVPENQQWKNVTIPVTGSLSASLECLSPLQWINVFGSNYVSLLGRENLLSLTTYKVEEDSAGKVWLQLTEFPEQMYLDSEKAKPKQFMDQLRAADMFCREPQTPDEIVFGIKNYRAPVLDRTKLQAL